MTRFKADLLILAVAFNWGIAFYFQKTGLESLGPMWFVAARASIAALAALPLAHLERRHMGASPVVPWKLVLAGGLIFFISAEVQQVGLLTATVTNAGFLTALYVVITPFFAWLIGGHRPSAGVWLAAIMAFAGIWALGGGSVSALSQGDILIAISAVGWSLYMVTVARVGKSAGPMQFTARVFMVTALLTVPAALLFEPTNLAAISMASVLHAAPSLLFVGIVSSAINYALLSIAFRYVPPAHAAVLVSTETLFAAAAGYWLLGERLTPLGWFGAALVMAAVLLIQTRRAAKAPEAI